VDKNRSNTKKSAILSIISLFLIVFYVLPAKAAVGGAVRNELPASTNPARVSEQITEEQPSANPPALSPLVPLREEGAASPLGKEAERITFKLTKIILEGNHVYSEKQLRKLYQAKLNTTISVSKLIAITQDITNYYRNNGYILSRAVLPPQHIQNGVVHIRVLEGFIDKVNIVGDPRGARQLLQAYGNKITKLKPLTLKGMEYYLLLANAVPGVSVRAVLEPSKKNVGASELNLVTQSQTVNGFFSYDTYGTLYIGPQQLSAGAQFNSIFRSGDVTYFNYATTPQPQELKFAGITYQTLLGSNGVLADFAANKSVTKPQFTLASSKIQGNAETYSGTVKFPLIRSRAQNLTFRSAFTYLDSQVTSFGALLYADHLRPITLALDYDFADRFRGTNNLMLSADQGLPILGATNDVNSVTTSRFGGRGVFTKFNVSTRRLQALWSRYSLNLVAQGQYALNPLLVPEQYGFGGNQLGRGYDPSEIIGDRGASGSIEFRADFTPGLRFFQAMEMYAFYDAGEIWNLKNVSGIETKQSATSTGVGTRFNFTSYLSGNVMISQPLTKQIAAEEQIGDGRRPRVQFNLTALL
jgi:hemolysin activation/secretion protein